MKTKIIRPCYNLTGLVILFAFALYLTLLISFDYSTSSRGRNGSLSPLVNNFADAINSSQNSKNHRNFRDLSKENQNTSDLDSCFGQYIYLHDLPRRFNDGVVNNFGRYLWGDDYSMRDSLSTDMCNWLVSQPEWKRMLGRDHFFVAGKIAWDFHRQSDNRFYWGSKLNTFPEFMNMTMLTIESSFRSNEFSIPYPSNFHPSSKGEVLEWQNKMRNRTRRHLFSFAGKQRPSMKDSIRSQIIRQCLASGTFCKLIECFPKPEGTTCDNPVAVVEWHLPKNSSKYSVFIPMDDIRDGKVSINMTLDQVSKDDIWAMREEVIRLIPNIVYANPRSTMESLEDAFSIAVKGVLERVGNIRKITWERKDPSIA
ncbi:putative xyloglucan galactosyltransferase GT14 [Citrus sinensis]|uniref:Xyloglucan galactosyltransferase GT14 n=1 Tax=Citrus sinensis TaxID=2711 RepID=A0ACB8HZY9_CITSI|nr:putative xyloglucan galactosyltransferase GT14 [Citrus sinensis]